MTQSPKDAPAVQFLRDDPNARIPSYESAGAAGMDLRAALGMDAEIEIAPGERRLVPTGLRMSLPDGFEAQIRPRSGLALKNGITVLNAPGTIDADYRGPIGVVLINHGHAPFKISTGDRIAQMVIAPVSRLQISDADTLDATDRGAGGFGSTGVK